MIFPEPVISIAIEPKTKADVEKLGVALQKLAYEDPSFRTSTRTRRPGQTIIAGMGELHLDIIVDRLRREFKVESNVGKPEVAYREAIAKKVDCRVQVRQAVRRSRPVRPRAHRRSSPASAARASSSRTTSSAASSRRSSSRRSRRASARRWTAASSPAIPIIDVKAALYDGSYHDVDSIAAGLRDRRLARLPGRRQARGPPPARAGHERTRSSSPSSTWATSSATSTRAAARSSA